MQITYLLSFSFTAHCGQIAETPFPSETTKFMTLLNSPKQQSPVSNISVATKVNCSVWVLNTVPVH